MLHTYSSTALLSKFRKIALFFYNPEKCSSWNGLLLLRLFALAVCVFKKRLNFYFLLFVFTLFFKTFFAWFPSGFCLPGCFLFMPCLKPDSEGESLWRSLTLCSLGGFAQQRPMVRVIQENRRYRCIFHWGHSFITTTTNHFMWTFTVNSAD